MRKIVFVVILGAQLSSCEYNVESDNLQMVDTCENVVSYADFIRPLIDNNCMPCHNGDGTEPFAPNLTTYTAVESIASLIKDVTQSRRMPKDGTLTEAEIAAIGCWVDDGAQNN